MRIAKRTAQYVRLATFIAANMRRDLLTKSLIWWDGELIATRKLHAQRCV
jgi:hypothetical protein